ncbi:MAG: hypothetical protein WCJ39_03960 [bacterium]
MIERERTFIAKSLPIQLKSCNKKQIIDVYIPGKDGMAQLRARKKGDNYELTKKVPLQEGNNAVQAETTIPINQEEFDYLYTYLPCKIKKERYEYQENTIIYEIDIFQGHLSGLALVDVEFEEERQMNNFIPPKFLGKEVTHDKKFA